MTSRPLVYLGIFIVIVAVISAAGYVIKNPAQKGENDPPASSDNTGTSTPQSGNASSTSPETPQPNLNQVSSTATSTGLKIPLPASSTTDTSSWMIYIDPENRFSIEHPKNLVRSYSSGVATFTFPKNLYFTWPLLDEAKISVSVEPKCPEAIKGGLRGDNFREYFELNGYSYVRTIGQDAAAGNRYMEVAYDIVKDANTCYHISFFNHGANGAGLYVDSASLIKRYDSEHAAALEKIYAILNGMVSSFRILAE